MDASLDNSNIKELRIKTAFSEPEYRLRKKVFGGYNINDTDEYIRNLEEQLQRAESAYNERLDEYSTFCEMVSKEKDTLSAEVEALKTKQASFDTALMSVKSDNIRLLDELKVAQTVIDDLNKKLSEKEKISEEDIKTLNENMMLKAELKDLYVEREKIAVDNASLKKQLDLLKSLSEVMKKDNKEQLDIITSLNAKIRHFEMIKKLKLSEYAEKEEYIIGRAEQGIQEIFTMLDGMKKDISELQEGLKNT